MPTTADEIRRRLQLITDETSDALKQYAAIGELRRKVERLRHECTNGESDAACDAAASKLVKASEDLRLAELVEPRKKAASDAATARRSQAAVAEIRAIMGHFERLNNEAREVAVKVVFAMPSPLAMQIRHEEGGGRRDMVLGQLLDLMPAVFESGQAYGRAYSSHNAASASAAENNLATMLETLDETTEIVRAQISDLRKILAAIGGSEAASAGGGLGDSPGATAEAEELATV
ncbi:hypothetical protein [Luteolibacter soli]|uniref:Uncharacterized protein n=1 Tax=Luteolibacter soli TaxID=3135280 RepID=A0ABU9AS38_9BACT